MAFERRRLSDGRYALVSLPVEDAGFLAAFSERTGGRSDPPFESLNLSFSVGDDPANVRENRKSITRDLLSAPFATGGQVHGARMVRVGLKRRGAGFDGSAPLPRADGLFTASGGVPLAVLTADCVPLVLASPKARLVAVVHAGWRGMASGVLSVAARLFEDRGEVRVAIGPAIGPCHYEVGQEVALAVAAGSDAGAVTQRREGGTYLDLPATAKRVLRSLGIRRVSDAGVCTACEPSRFFSHRRDGATGRQAALAERVS